MTYKERRSAEKQERRLRVYEKFNHRCAYCGCGIDYYDFHIDHVNPKRRYKNKDHYLSDIPKGSDEESNLFPACASCNCCKTDRDLESFRNQILTRVHRLNESFGEYQIAKRFGLVLELEQKVVFYFETIS